MENQNKKNIPAQPEFSGESSPEYNTGEKDSKQKNRVKEILEYAESLTLVFAVDAADFYFHCPSGNSRRNLNASNLGRSGTPGDFQSVL